jgi:hypothetical protein
MANLVEETKKLRERKNLLDKLVVQEVEWDLDHRFIGEPMVPRTLKALSRFVDLKLVGYSAILGSVPATNMPHNAVKVPPTDNVIAFKAMIETSENLFKNMGNVYKMTKKAA